MTNNNDMTTDESAVLSGLLVTLKVILAGAVAAAIVTAEPVHAADRQLGSALDRVEEDSPDWDCVGMGNRICGPGNARGVVPGCYDDGGVLVAPWPCHVIVDGAGNGAVYTGAR